MSHRVSPEKQHSATGFGPSDGLSSRERVQRQEEEMRTLDF
jgi:hypothetical protein